MSIGEIRAVVAIDFGVTYSAFAYANKLNPEIITNDCWPEQNGTLKTNTALLYDENFEKVEEWGYPALAKRPKRNKGISKSQPKPVENFKLHLSDMPEHEKPILPKGLSYKKAISDYLREMGKLIKDTLNTRWPSIKFMEQVLIILTVPGEFSDEKKAIMRECVFNAGLIAAKNSERLQFAIESEATAIYCVKSLKERLSNVMGSNLLIVNCGENTVDLTTRQLLSYDRLGEKSIRTGGLCGENYIDKAFLSFVGERVGPSAIQAFQENHYGQLQYLVQEFCKKVKCLFTGNIEEYKPFELDLDEVCPAIKEYVTDEKSHQLEDDEWIIELKFEDVKRMFDDEIKKIIKLIYDQLNSVGAISVIFLVGDFSESKYLQKRINEEFSTKVNMILIPSQPMAATVRGALEYGLSMHKVKPRILPLSYGIELGSIWKPSDPSERQQTYNRIFKFRRLVERGREVNVNEEFGLELYPSYKGQTEILIEIYSTTAIEADFCDEPGMKKIGKLRLDFPDPHLGSQRKIKFSLIFGQMEIRACASNHQGKSTSINFELEF